MTNSTTMTTVSEIINASTSKAPEKAKTLATNATLTLCKRNANAQEEP